MIKNHQCCAFLLEKRLFDQSVVGIFPKEKGYLNYLLAFLNSQVCNKILKVINHTANNSANYLKKLPIIINKDALKEIDMIMNRFWKINDAETTLQNINIIFNQLYKI